MAISIDGFTLYRPTASFKRQFFKDNYSEIIGVQDDVTISDQVTYADNSDLIGLLDSIVAASKTGSFINVTYNDISCQGRIKSLSVDSDSDIVNILKYSVSIEAFPTNIAFATKWGLTPADGVRDLTCTESGEDPKDRSIISLENGQTYWNKVPTFTFNMQVSCGRINNNQNAKDLAKGVVKKLKKTAPVLLAQAIPSRFDGAIYYSGLEESYNEDGSANLQITASIFPDGGIPGVLIENVEKTVNSYGGEKKYKTKQYKATFKGVPNMGLGTTGVSSAASQNVVGHAESLAGYFTGTNGGTPEVSTPGVALVCKADIPPLPEGSCYNTTSVGIEKNYSDATATVTIEQTTEPTNCDGDGYVVEYSIDVEKNKRAHAELFGWNSPRPIIQDLKCEATETRKLQINVSSIAKCLTSALKTKALAKYNELSADLLSSGTLVKHSLSINGSRCSISADFIMSKGTT